MVHLLTSLPMVPVYSLSHSSKITKQRSNSNLGPILTRSDYYHHQQQQQQQLVSSLPLSTNFYNQQQQTENTSIPTYSLLTSFNPSSQSYQTTSTTIDSSPFYTEPITPVTTPRSDTDQVIFNFRPTTMKFSSNTPPNQSSLSSPTNSGQNTPTRRGSGRARGRRTGPNSNLRCDICNQYYSRKDNLRAHQRVHSGEKPYECRYCHSRFRWAGALRTHEGIHERNGHQPSTRNSVPTSLPIQTPAGPSNTSTPMTQVENVQIPYYTPQIVTMPDITSDNINRMEVITTQGIQLGHTIVGSSTTSMIVPELNLPTGSIETNENPISDHDILNNEEELAVSPLFQDAPELLPRVLDDNFNDEEH